MTEDTPQASMQRLADGDRAALEPLYAALWPVLRRFCIALLRHEADGEDVAQKTMLKLAANATRFDPERDVTAWALSMAAWECRSFTRQRARRAQLLHQHREDPHLMSVLTQANEDMDPEQGMQHTAERAMVDELLRQLPTAEQQTIAEILAGNTPPASARWRKRKQRALTRLQALWKGQTP